MMGETDLRIHFVGVAGTGMSALAQIHALSGAVVTGSDRAADRGILGDTRARLEAAGIKFFPQDGSALCAQTNRVVVSTAIEPDNADLKRARQLDLRVVHRADELAALCENRRTIAVAGTSGKSTVTAMIFHILETAGRAPGLAAGANVPALRRKGLVGNAWRGESRLLVMEADESDGTLTRYKPELGLLLNVSKDHKDTGELLELFRRFRAQCGSFAVNADAPGLSAYYTGSLTFGFSTGDLRGRDLRLSAEDCRFRVADADFLVPAPGRHNAENALAAAAACKIIGVDLALSAAALRAYEGVGRRFELVGSAGGVEVIDDFAHNPEKVRAVLGAARLRAKRLLVVFQLHGFAPARFLKDELIKAFAETLRPEDVLWLPDIYYVGGTAAKDISAEDYARPLKALGFQARHAPRREAIGDEIAQTARSGDIVLVLGARDATLSEFAAGILERLKKARLPT